MQSTPFWLSGVGPSSPSSFCGWRKAHFSRPTKNNRTECESLVSVEERRIMHFEEESGAMERGGVGGDLNHCKCHLR